MSSLVRVDGDWAVKVIDRNVQVPLLEIPESERSKLRISVVVIDGRQTVQSYYADPIWVMTPRTTNLTKASRIVRFKSIPTCFEAAVRECLWVYMFTRSVAGDIPAAQTVVNTFVQFRFFVRFLVKQGITDLAAVDSTVCAAYAHFVNNDRRKTDGKHRAVSGKMKRLLGVEILYKASQRTQFPIPEAPWPGASAISLSGALGFDARFAKTPIIPEKVLSSIFKASFDILAEADEILQLRDEVLRIRSSYTTEKYWTSIDRVSKFLSSRSPPTNGKILDARLMELRTACYIIVATLSGCRNHELVFIKNSSWFSTVSESVIYWWVRSRTTKGGVLDTEWMVPQAAIRALEIAQRLAKPFQDEIRREIAERVSRDPRDPEIAEANNHVEAVFLGARRGRTGGFRTLTTVSANICLKQFVNRRGMDWNLSTHQFRRTFAVYVAASQLGDIRYLREHFKHWSLDMTLLYALNKNQEQELFEEIEAEYSAIRQAVVESWLSPDEPLSGGAGRHIVSFRMRHPVVLRNNHKQMVRGTAQSVRLRATGHAWCMAPNDDCGGRTQLEFTRCVDCHSGVIGRVHADIYKEQMLQSDELLKLTDLGPGGIAHVQRTRDACAKVLSELEGPAQLSEET